MTALASIVSARQFMSVSSHELKTPVTAMSGFLRVALRRIRKRPEAGPPDADS